MDFEYSKSCPSLNSEDVWMKMLGVFKADRCDPSSLRLGAGTSPFDRQKTGTRKCPVPISLTCGGSRSFLTDSAYRQDLRAIAENRINGQRDGSIQRLCEHRGFRLNQ
jgi:hypothetical protein